MPENAEIALCGGFFLIYFIDEFVHFFFGDAIHNLQAGDNHEEHSHAHVNGHSHEGYGSTHDSENRPLLK